MRNPGPEGNRFAGWPMGRRPAILECVARGWALRIQPYIGVVLTSLGLWILLLVWERGTWSRGAPLGLMAVAGVGMIGRASRGRRRLLLFGVAVAAGLSFFWVSAGGCAGG